MDTSFGIFIVFGMIMLFVAVVTFVEDANILGTIFIVVATVLLAFGFVFCSKNSMGWAAKCDPGLYTLSHTESSFSNGLTYMSLRATSGKAKSYLRLCRVPASSVHLPSRTLPQTIRLVEDDDGLHVYPPH